MGRKRTYRAVNVKRVDRERLFEQIGGKRVVVGTDVGKEECFGCFMDESRKVHVTVKWNNPGQSREFVELVKQVGGEGIEVAMEPSGTYGDGIRNLLRQAGVEVYRVSGKRSHDAAEVYDGVPSHHDAKSAAIVAKLHWDGASERWPLLSERERDLGAAVKTMELLQEQYQQNVNRLEGSMARHWPEVSGQIDLGSATFLELLIQVGGPQEVWGQQGRSRKVMRRVGGSLLKEETIEGVIGSAGQTIGVTMSRGELEELRTLAGWTRQLSRGLAGAKKKVERLGKGDEVIEAIGQVVGKATAAVLVTQVGDPRRYDSGQQWLKGSGLNLKERSSGKWKGKLKITKRGSGQARRWLYFAALRLIRKDAVVQGWYERKVARDGGVKKKAIVAIMRKLLLGLWHVAHRASFDTTRMFDTRGLCACQG